MNIYESISKILSDIPAIGKDKVNTTQHFKFRGIDDVMNALNPILAKYKVFVVPQILEQIREERQSKTGGTLIYSICKIKYTFYAEDGTSVEAITIGEGMDSGDKATNKAMAIAMKYALFQVFCIPTEEMVDPDAESPEVTKKEPEQTDKIDQTQVQALNNYIAKNKIDHNALESILSQFDAKEIKDIDKKDLSSVSQALRKLA